MQRKARHRYQCASQLAQQRCDELWQRAAGPAPASVHSLPDQAADGAAAASAGADPTVRRRHGCAKWLPCMPSLSPRTVWQEVPGVSVAAATASAKLSVHLPSTGASCRASLQTPGSTPPSQALPWCGTSPALLVMLACRETWQASTLGVAKTVMAPVLASR